MRYNVYENGGSIEGLITISGLAVTGFLKLSNDPVELLEASTKQYVDTQLLNRPATAVKSGVFIKDVLPTLTGGGVVNNAGGSVLSLTNTGVAPNTYTKITVGTNGLVTNGTSLSANDIPSIGFNKITSGRPTTLEGYGILDSVSRTGGTVNGNVTLNGNPVDSSDTVTKQYADSKTLGDREFAIGDLLTGEYDTTPTGFLRCNGGELSKELFPELYSFLNSDDRPNIVYNTGKPWEHQFLINKETNTDIVSWNESVSLPTPVSKAQACVIKGKVYLLGGNTGSSSSNKIYKGELTAEGVVTEWVESGTLPLALEDFELVVHDNHIYVLGGKTNTTFSNKTYKSVINPDGTLGTWATGSNLPSVLAGSQALVINNKIYMFGGFTSNSVTTTNIYSSTITGNGALTSWNTEAGTLSLSLGNSKLVTTRNRIYLVGGVSGTTKQKKVMTIPINPDGTLGACSISPAGTQTAVNASFKVNNVTTVFPGNNNLTSVPTESVTVNDLPTTSAKTANLVVPAGGFITVEYIRKETISLNLNGSGKLYLPNGVTSFNYTGAGSPGTAYNPGQSYHPGQPYVAPTYGPAYWVASGGPYSTCRTTSRGNSTTLPAPSAGEFASTWTTGAYGSCTNGYLESGQLYVGRQDMIDPGQPYIAPTPYIPPSSASWGQSGQLYYNGQTITLPAGYGGSYSTVQGSVNTVDQYPVINYSVPSGGYCTITYTFDNPNYFQTYLANTNITIPDYVTTVRVYGKGAHWLKELPVTVSEHAMYTTSDKAYIIGGGGVSNIYSTNIDEFGIFSSWVKEGNFPENLSFSTLVSVKDKLMLLGGVTASTTNKVYSSNFIGGINDYTDVQTAVLGGILVSPNFRLPDYTSQEDITGNVYVKF